MGFYVRTLENPLKSLLLLDFLSYLKILRLSTKQHTVDLEFLNHPQINKSISCFPFIYRIQIFPLSNVFCINFSFAIGFFSFAHSAN